MTRHEQRYVPSASRSQRDGQTRPQAPHDRRFDRIASQALDGSPSQSAEFAGHTSTQPPATHDGAHPGRSVPQSETTEHGREGASGAFRR